MCNLAYAWQRADLVAALAMTDGKQRQRALDAFEEQFNAPPAGWEAVDRAVTTAILTAA